MFFFLNMFKMHVPYFFHHKTWLGIFGARSTLKFWNACEASLLSSGDDRAGRDYGCLGILNGFSSFTQQFEQLDDRRL
jgi:hypothetical protein